MLVQLALQDIQLKVAAWLPSGQSKSSGSVPSSITPVSDSTSGCSASDEPSFPSDELPPSMNYLHLMTTSI